MYCQKCGKEMTDGSSFCPVCGNQTGTGIHQQPIIVNVVNKNENINTNNNGGNYPYKSKWTAFFLCLFLGGFGFHRFYVGKVGTGILWLLTIGLFGIGWLMDLLMILFGTFRDKAGYPLQ